MPQSITPDSSPLPSDVPSSDPPAPGDHGVDSSQQMDLDMPEPTSSTAKGQEAGLEAMFDDDSDEGEFSSSSAVPSSALQAPPTGPQSKYTEPEVMRAFYQRLFPYRYLFQWLNHASAPTADFSNREFAFTLPNDVYLRYQSFASHDLFRKQCVALIPSRFEIGPVYSTNPRDRKSLRRAAAFKPVSKELVFDIDMTDYDEIRTCCTGASICQRCWSFIRVAIRTLDLALREDFGFEHILWVYSGRRGVHAWVCDKRARDMDDRKRTAVAAYMELLKGGDGTKKKVNVRRPLHPHLERSLKMLRENFQTDILKEQDPWASDAQAQRLLDLLPDSKLNDALSRKWQQSPGRSSMSKWNDIDTLASAGETSDSFDAKKLLEAKQDIVLEYTYPRLDSNVSKHLNHLLKSPFCVHPGTGRICVPIDPRNVDDFDPLEVPTVTQLLSEIDEWTREHDAEMGSTAERRTSDWEKTSMRPYVEYFRSFVGELMKEEMTVKRRRADEDATPGMDMEF